MKVSTITLAVAAAAATLTVPTAAYAAHDRGHTKTVVKKVIYTTFKKGQRFDHKRAKNYRVIDYRTIKGLRAPARGYRYVRAGNDVLLIRDKDLVVVTVFANRF
ncbi:RcnB family protein [Qipengyuania qiaonensis]|uniref:RcnB family protein n=1 Tax=Qipengyuania qiaonensis TaxID=2867240 RepID=A0ABS7J8X7_9SPHN|nr:RcnB family protein [Qipengyuania qiaonensis]MBX7483776.1 RcnB family protein [Qipengyuania qiaonensis]